MGIGSVADRDVMAGVAAAIGVASRRHVETGAEPAVAAGSVGARARRNVHTGIAGGIGVRSGGDIVAAGAVGERTISSRNIGAGDAAAIGARSGRDIGAAD